MICSKETEINGVRWVWSEVGTGPPLVLLPGFAASRKIFFPLSRLLQDQFKVILVDPPGFETPLPLPMYRLSQQVTILHQWAIHLGLSEMIIGGNSAGGQLATLYALRQPQTVCGLALFAPQGCGDEDYTPNSQKPPSPQNISEMKAHLADLYHRPPHFSDADCAAMIEKQQAQWSWHNQIRAEVRGGEEHRLNGQLAHLSVPTLVIWGAEDRRIPPRMGALWQAGSKKVTLHTLPECGHLPQLEQTESCARSVRQFFLVRHSQF